jgi:catechol 2,3-dioxygenase-like lactoylglutathione lyase family enzyme
MAGETFDRRLEDIGNIVHLEHVNVRVPDQQLATQFYVVALGLTRDPYLMIGLENMWINVGHSQFHLPTAAAQVLRGVTGLVIPDFDELPARLAAASERLKGTKFSYSVSADHADVTCPWGNHLRLHRPSPRFPRMELGMPYVELPVPSGTAPGIARFYTQIMNAPAEVVANGGVAAEVKVGTSQKLVFHETSEPLMSYDGHHIAIYIADFSGPHDKMVERGIVSEESNPYQYRFVEITDPDSGKVMFELEHEVRCVTHPMYRRPLINRNPAQRQPTYVAGRDARVWA